MHQIYSIADEIAKKKVNEISQISQKNLQIQEAQKNLDKINTKGSKHITNCLKTKESAEIKKYSAGQGHKTVNS